jgi:hypothetical protein
MVRYYEWYSNRKRGDRLKAELLLGNCDTKEIDGNDPRNTPPLHISKVFMTKSELKNKKAQRQPGFFGDYFSIYF